MQAKRIFLLILICALLSSMPACSESPSIGPDDGYAGKVTVSVNLGNGSHILRPEAGDVPENFELLPGTDGQAEVIVRNGKVCAAGCILPSSKSPDIPKELGTRHRAAVGISEQSDAVVIVVSEETGTISIANNGILKRGYNSGTLKDDLFLLLSGNTEEEIRRLQQKNEKQ